MPTIRPAKIKDGKAVAALHLEMMRMHRQFGEMFAMNSKSRQIAEDWFTKVPRRRNNKMWVAEADGKVVGYLWAKLWKRPAIYKEINWGEIADLYVDESHRKQGVAKDMMKEAFKWFKEKGIKTASLYVASDNVVAQEVWKAFKFKEYFKKMYRSL